LINPRLAATRDVGGGKGHVPIAKIEGSDGGTVNNSRVDEDVYCKVVGVAYERLLQPLSF